MLTHEDLQAIAQLMDMKLEQKLDPINNRLDKIEGRLDRIEADIVEMKEDAVITRTGVNALIEWAENVSVQIKIPLLHEAE